MRELVRNVWARTFVYPTLLANERSQTALASYIRQRGKKLDIAVNDDGRTLRPVAPHATLMSKIELRAHPERYTRKRRLNSLIRSKIMTSGTSGSPLTLIQDLACTIREEAFIYRQLHWIGFRQGQRRAWLRGDLVCPDHPKNGVYWCRDWVANMLMMSSYHMSSDTIALYIDELERFDPVILHAYPTSIAVLAAWMKANGRVYRGQALRGVMTSSETLEPAVRANISATFGVPSFDWYGQAERVVAIGTCEQGSYHVLTDYSAVEVLPADDGNLELVGTSFNNLAMSLQHYRTGDTVTGIAPACSCGRLFPVIDSILGRKDKTITLPDGRHVTRFSLVFQNIDSIIEGQVIYQGNAAFKLKVVTTAAFSEDDAEALRARFLHRIPGVSVSVEKVVAIPRGPNGKFAFVVIADGQ